jgi:CRP/FNR family cyclic AMP-dependent transcriptional regulator
MRSTRDREEGTVSQHAPGVSGVARLTPKEADLRLAAEVVEHFRAVGTRRVLEKGTVIEQIGTPARAFWVLLSGQLRIYSTDQTGKQITINTILPGESAGETVVAEGPRNSSVCAEIDSEVIEVSPEEFRRAVVRFPDFGLQMMRRLSYVVRGLCEQVRALALDDVYARVVRLILESSHVIDGVRMAPKLSHGEMARRIGASRSMVNRVMAELVEGGYVEVRDAELVIRKRLPDRW